MREPFRAEMDIKLEGDEVIVTRPNDLKKMKSLHGLTRTLIHNMVVGVTDGYEKRAGSKRCWLQSFQSWERNLL